MLQSETLGHYLTTAASLRQLPAATPTLSANIQFFSPVAVLPSSVESSPPVPVRGQTSLPRFQLSAMPFGVASSWLAVRLWRDAPRCFERRIVAAVDEQVTDKLLTFDSRPAAAAAWVSITVAFPRPLYE